MAQYKEILNEIQEQIDELQAEHDAKSAQIAAIQQELPTLAQQVEQLEALKAQAALITPVTTQEVTTDASELS